ncbi:hypothetical protein ACKKBF_B14255 [Auxenochlorella protothecoides x Auxenochlorella symbiontica]
MGFGGRGTLRAGQVQRSPSLKDLAHRLAVTQDTNSSCENIMSQERGLLVATNPPPVVKDAQLDRLREEREVHRHRQIWTKDAHGGPYKKVNDGKGYDPLLQTPDGKDKEWALGYERVKVGPTTNFVGNHMTQAAIDLVQAHLQPPREPVSDPGALRLTQGAEHGPKLLQVTPPQSEQHAGSPIRALDRYRWQDAAESVDISVELPQNGPWDVTCEVTRGSLMLEARPQRGPQLRLHIPALCHAVTPEACRVIVACGEDHGEQAAVPSVSGVWAWKGHLPGGTLLLHLHKEQEGMQWQRLAAQKEDAGGDGARAPAAPAAAPDLDATRRALLAARRRGRPYDAQAALPATRPGPEPAGLPGIEDPTHGGGAASVSGPHADLLPEAAAAEAERAASAGEYVGAVRAASLALSAAPFLASSAGADLLLDRARWRTCLGDAAGAVADCSQVIDGEGVHSNTNVVTRALLLRASLREEGECLPQALQDVEAALSLAPGTPGLAVTRERLRTLVIRPQRGVHKTLMC